MQVFGLHIERTVFYRSSILSWNDYSPKLLNQRLIFTLAQTYVCIPNASLSFILPATLRCAKQSVESLLWEHWSQGTLTPSNFHQVLYRVVCKPQFFQSVVTFIDNISGKLLSLQKVFWSCFYKSLDAFAGHLATGVSFSSPLFRLGAGVCWR